MLQVECSVLPELGAKKRGSSRGAIGPITFQVPLSICLEPASALHIDGQAALGAGAASHGPASHMLTDNATQPHAASPSVDASEEVTPYPNQASVRSSRSKSNGKRRKRAAEEADEVGKAEEAGPSGGARASKQQKPDLQPLQDELLRWVPRQSQPLPPLYNRQPAICHCASSPGNAPLACDKPHVVSAPTSIHTLTI